MIGWSKVLNLENNSSITLQCLKKAIPNRINFEHPILNKKPPSNFRFKIQNHHKHIFPANPSQHVRSTVRLRVRTFRWYIVHAVFVMCVCVRGFFHVCCVRPHTMFFVRTIDAATLRGHRTYSQNVGGGLCWNLLRNVCVVLHLCSIHPRVQVHVVLSGCNVSASCMFLCVLRDSIYNNICISSVCVPLCARLFQSPATACVLFVMPSAVLASETRHYVVVRLWGFICVALRKTMLVCVCLALESNEPKAITAGDVVLIIVVSRSRCVCMYNFVTII